MKTRNIGTPRTIIIPLYFLMYTLLFSQCFYSVSVKYSYYLCHQSYTDGKWRIYVKLKQNWSYEIFLLVVRKPDQKKSLLYKLRISWHRLQIEMGIFTIIPRYRWWNSFFDNKYKYSLAQTQLQQWQRPNRYVGTHTHAHTHIS